MKLKLLLILGLFLISGCSQGYQMTQEEKDFGVCYSLFYYEKRGEFPNSNGHSALNDSEMEVMFERCYKGGQK